MVYRGKNRTHELIGIRRCEVFEACMLAEESQPDAADWTITLLGNDDFGGAFIRRVRVVNLVAVNEENQVSILLDRTGFAQIGHYRTLVRALFNATIEL